MKNRDGNEIIFEQIAPNKYNFKIIDIDGNDASYYWGFTGNKDDVISIDPSGGPFLYIGDSIYPYTGRRELITKIYFDNGCIIETKND